MGNAAEPLDTRDEPGADPTIGPLFGADEDGNAAVNPLVPMVLEHMQEKEDGTCYAALLEGLTGIWKDLPISAFDLSEVAWQK